jgi:hypothetical protein
MALWSVFSIDSPARPNVPAVSINHTRVAKVWRSHRLLTFGPDLTNFVRQGNTRGLFENRSVVSVLTGEPEYLDPLGDETPVGWIVTGYPQAQVATPANIAFITAYTARFGAVPGWVPSWATA